MCKDTARKSDIRRLFFSDIKIYDEMAYHSLQTNYIKEKSIRERVRIYNKRFIYFMAS